MTAHLVVAALVVELCRLTPYLDRIISQVCTDLSILHGLSRPPLPYLTHRLETNTLPFPRPLVAGSIRLRRSIE